MTSVAFDRKRRVLVVETLLTGPKGGRTVRLALDTGASVTVVSSRILETIGCQPVKDGSLARIMTASGIEEVQRVLLYDIVALGHSRTNLAIVSHTLPSVATVDGLLGLDFFEDTRFIIDLRAGTIEMD